jgi:multiple sugar transport system ATP-binding protein
LQKRLKTTTIYVTHDQVEAMTMGDRVALMNAGVLQQVDTPDGIYNRPANTFVASFIGSPAMNLFHARLAGEGDRVALVLGGQRLAVPPSMLAARPALASLVGSEVVVGIRPENLDDATLHPSHPPDQRLAAPVMIAESLGSDHMVHFTVEAPPAKVADRDTLGDLGASDAVTTCIGRFDARSAARSGDRIEVAFDCDRLHFFDARTGVAI